MPPTPSRPGAASRPRAGPVRRREERGAGLRLRIPGCGPLPPEHTHSEGLRPAAMGHRAPKPGPAPPAPPAPPGWSRPPPRRGWRMRRRRPRRRRLPHGGGKRGSGGPADPSAERGGRAPGRFGVSLRGERWGREGGRFSEPGIVPQRKKKKMLGGTHTSGCVRGCSVSRAAGAKAPSGGAGLPSSLC